jgi:hypothetical protein
MGNTNILNSVDGLDISYVIGQLPVPIFFTCLCVCLLPIFRFFLYAQTSQQAAMFFQRTKVKCLITLISSNDVKISFVLSFMLICYHISAKLATNIFVMCRQKSADKDCLHLCLGLPIGLSPSRFPAEVLFIFMIVMHAALSAHFRILDQLTLIISSEKHKVNEKLLMQ